MVIKLVAMLPRMYFKNAFNCLDAFVVIASWVKYHAPLPSLALSLCNLKQRPRMF